MGQVIGLLNYDDFVNELVFIEELEGLLHGDLNTRPITVRVQDYSKRSQGSIAAGMARIEFIVEAAAVYGDDLLLCRFRFGGGLTWEEERVERRRREALRAAEMVREDLERLGFDVRTGLFAAAKESETEARPGGLWHWEGEGEERVMVAGAEPLGG